MLRNLCTEPEKVFIVIKSNYAGLIKKLGDILEYENIHDLRNKKNIAGYGFTEELFNEIKESAKRILLQRELLE